METPSYYAIIPAEVRYDKELKPNEKLLYGEIAALTSKTGVCWASNSYFAELYDVDECTISRWIKQLKDKNYISIDSDFKDGLAFKQRTICIDKKVNTPCENNQEGIDEKVKHNNTSNKQYKNKRNIKEKCIPPSLEEVKEYIAERKYAVDAQHFYDYFEAGDWLDSQGKPVRNWKQKIITWNNNNQKRLSGSQEDPLKELLKEVQNE